MTDATTSGARPRGSRVEALRRLLDLLPEQIDGEGNNLLNFAAAFEIARQNEAALVVAETELIPEQRAHPWGEDRGGFIFSNDSDKSLVVWLLEFCPMSYRMGTVTWSPGKEPGTIEKRCVEPLPEPTPWANGEALATLRRCLRLMIERSAPAGAACDDPPPIVVSLSRNQIYGLLKRAAITYPPTPEAFGKSMQPSRAGTLRDPVLRELARHRLKDGRFQCPEALDVLTRCARASGNDWAAFARELEEVTKQQERFERAKVAAERFREMRASDG